MENKGYLLLEDGTLMEGILRGAQVDAVAELVFSTSVVGYMDALTDPRYDGQILLQTFPVIGNYGVVPLSDPTAKPCLKGYIAREICDEPCNFRCEGKLNDWLVANGIPCLTDVDTRALTRRLRDNGVMKAAILTKKPDDLAAALAMVRAAKGAAAPAEHSCTEVIPAQGKGMHHVALWDLGAVGAVQQELESRGCIVSRVPADISAEQLLALKPDGVLLSDGAGDPAVNEAIVGQIRELCRKHIPVMGIGLGHQLLALSQGGGTVKLKFGHRGGNQPVKDLKTGLNYLTAQNKGYAVDVNNLPENASLRFINANDGACEGLDYVDMPAFSVQFTPEVTGGPLDTRFLYERFIALIGGNKECR